MMLQKTDGRDSVTASEKKLKQEIASTRRDSPSGANHSCGSAIHCIASFHYVRTDGGTKTRIMSNYSYVWLAMITTGYSFST